jgi:hypothetical protein
LKEKFGVERVSTAFEFYMAVHRHLKLQQTYTTVEDKYMKPLMGATNYHLFYLASSQADAAIRDPDHVHMVLDRKKMWDCTPLNVSIRTTAAIYCRLQYNIIYNIIYIYIYAFCA